MENMKLTIEEKDETQRFRPIPVSQFLQAVKDYEDKIVVFVPNLCGGETRITIFKSKIPEGNPENVKRLSRKGPRACGKHKMSVEG
jgi:hypothetical protein